MDEFSQQNLNTLRLHSGNDSDDDQLREQSVEYLGAIGNGIDIISSSPGGKMSGLRGGISMNPSAEYEYWRLHRGQSFTSTHTANSLNSTSIIDTVSQTTTNTVSQLNGVPAPNLHLTASDHQHSNNSNR